MTALWKRATLKRPSNHVFCRNLIFSSNNSSSESGHFVHKNVRRQTRRQLHEVFLPTHQISNTTDDGCHKTQTVTCSHSWDRASFFSGREHDTGLHWRQSSVGFRTLIILAHMVPVHPDWTTHFEGSTDQFDLCPSVAIRDGPEGDWKSAEQKCLENTSHSPWYSQTQDFRVWQGILWAADADCAALHSTNVRPAADFHQGLHDRTGVVHWLVEDSLQHKSASGRNTSSDTSRFIDLIQSTLFTVHTYVYMAFCPIRQLKGLNILSLHKFTPL